MNRPNEEIETLREAFSASVRVAGEGRDCPQTEAVWKSARRELEPSEEDAVLMHIGECPACAAAWRIARDLTEDLSRRRSFRWVPLAAAAAVALVLVGVGLLDWPTRDDAVYRAGGDRWLQSLVPEDRILSRQDCLLRWTPGPEGTTYQVRVTDERLDFLARGRGLAVAEFRVPEAALEDLPPESKIFWQVTARLPDGTVSDSTSFVSRVE